MLSWGGLNKTGGKLDFVTGAGFVQICVSMPDFVSVQAFDFALNRGCLSIARTRLERTFMSVIGAKWYSFTSPQLLMSSEKVLTNWPAKMSHSPYGECDFDPQRTGETPGPEQPLGRAHDAGSGRCIDGRQRTPHQAHPRGLPGNGRCCPGSRQPGPQAAQCNPRGPW